MPPCGQTRRVGGGAGGAVVSQLTDLSSDVLKGSRADQGEAYQEHILGETREMTGCKQSLYKGMNFYGNNSS